MSETGFLQCVGQTNTLAVRGVGISASPLCFPSWGLIKFTRQKVTCFIYSLSLA